VIRDAPALVTETKKIGDGLPETREKQKQFGQKVAESNAAIHRGSQKNDPTYVPPKETAAPAATAAPQSLGIRSLRKQTMVSIA
jgi:hypothetical protein